MMESVFQGGAGIAGWLTPADECYTVLVQLAAIALAKEPDGQLRHLVTAPAALGRLKFNIGEVGGVLKFGGLLP